MVYNRKEFEDRYLNKYVYVKIYDNSEFKGYLYSTKNFIKETGIADHLNCYFVGNNIRENTTRFKKAHITNIRLLKSKGD